MLAGLEVDRVITLLANRKPSARHTGQLGAVEEVVPAQPEAEAVGHVLVSFPSGPLRPLPLLYLLPR